MHDGNVGGLGDAALNFEALGRFDVFKVDAPKRLGDVHDGVDEFLGVFGVNFNIENVDAGEGLQEKALAFHDRFAGKSTNVPEAKNGRTVGDDRDQISLGGVAVSVFRSLFDFKARKRHAGRVGQAQFVSRSVWFGGHDLDLSLRLSLVVLKRLLAQHLVFFARGQGDPHRKGGEAGFDCCARLKPCR